jgi:flagellar protein FliO/FliZ
LYSIKKSLQVLLIFFFVFYGTTATTYAENLDGTVKDHFNQLDKKEDKKTDDTMTKEKASDPASAGLSFWDFLRMISATIFVVALLYLMLRFINKKSRTYQRANFVENIGGTSLGSNRSIQIVKVGKRILVVGVGEDIQLLKEIDDDSEYQDILNDYNQRMDKMIQPADIITKIQRRLSKTKDNKTGFLVQFKKQLEEFSKHRKKMIKELNQKGSNKE